MKNLTKKLIFMLAAILCLSGCTAKSANNDEKLNVYTSFYCIYDLTQKIAGDKVNITNLIPPGTEPHDWEPTSGDMARLSECDVLFCNGLNMEGWLESIQNSANVNTVVLADGIADLAEQSDPHIWLDPMYAKQMAAQICTTLSQLDSENADFYNANLEELNQKFDALDESYRTALAPYSGKKIVVSHMAYSYLCSAYDLEQVPIDGLYADSEPSPRQVKQIIDTIKQNDIKVVFYEELLSKKIADTIAEETNAQLLPLNPIEGLTDEQSANGDDYFSIMEENLKNLKTALE